MFSLNELVDAAREAMADWPAPTNRQIRALPDVRTLRYYTHLGLLDRPVAFRGRTALYGRRHLLQVLAIKRLQFGGRSLEQIQEDLYGADAELLEQVVGGNELPESAAGERLSKPKSQRAKEFWKETVRAASSEQRAEQIGSEQRATSFAVEPQRVTQLSVAPGATLVLPLEHLSEEAFAELPAALAPLQEWLAKHLGTTSHNQTNQERGNDQPSN